MRTSHPPLVGRSAAVRDLVGAVDRACAGSGGLVLVTGEPGVGKTHLVREVTEVVADRAEVGWGAGGPVGGVGPFRVWIQALRSLDADGMAVVGRLASFGVEGADAPVEGRESARLGLFDEVAANLRALAQRRPVVVVIDDLHRAERSSLALLAFLAPPLHTAPVAVVVTACLDDPGIDPASRVVLRRVARQAQVITLDPLDMSATRSLVTALTGAAVPDAVVAAIHARTEGNPLFVTELVRLLQARDELFDLPGPTLRVVPDSVREVVDQRLARVSEAGRTLLTVAAVLGTEVETDLLAAVSNAAAPNLEVAQTLREAEAAHLITRHGPDAHRFTHALFRAAIYNGLVPADRRRLHGTAARVLAGAREEGRDVPAAVIASHLAATGDPDDRLPAVEHLRAAAANAAVVHAYEDAAAHLGDALALARQDAGSEALQAELLVALGDACVALGDLPAARDAFTEAADRARAAGRPVLLARAAMGIGSGEVGFEVPLFDQQQIGLLEEALAGLPPSEGAWAARLRARLSVAVSLTEDEPGRVELCEAAIATARQIGDDGALASALAAHCDAVAGPDHSEQRGREASEVIRLARDRGDLRTELLGRRLRLVARLEQGDMTGAGADIDAFAEVAGRLDEPLFSWYPPLWRAMRLLLAGRADDARRHTERARQIGESAHSINAVQLGDTQRCWLVIETGDLDRLAMLAAEFEDMFPPATWARVALAMVHAQLGRRQAARVLFDRLVDELPGAPVDSEWLPMLGQVAETVELVGPHPIAAWAHAAMMPHRHRHVVEGIAAVMRGSVERPLGTLAAALGDREGARAHFDAALAANRRLGGAGLVARTLRDAGVALGAPESLRAAATLYEELGWHRRVAEVRDHLARRPDPAEVGSARRPGPQPVRGTFRPDGDGWHLRWHDVSVRVGDLKGLHDLAWLLAHPHRETPALDLLTATDPGRAHPAAVEVAAHGPEGDLGEVLDGQARDSYRRRLAELEEEIADAEAAHDAVRRERCVEERDFLVSELAAAYGLGGRVRRAGHPAERARTTVTSRIRYAIERVTAAHPELGQHLSNAVRTGRLCSYTPEHPVVWEL